MTLTKARKILGKLAEKLTDDEVMKEIETATMVAEVVLLSYKEDKNKNIISQNQNA